MNKAVRNIVIKVSTRRVINVAIGKVTGIALSRVMMPGSNTVTNKITAIVPNLSPMNKSEKICLGWVDGQPT